MSKAQKKKEHHSDRKTAVVSSTSAKSQNELEQEAASPTSQTQLYPVTPDTSCEPKDNAFNPQETNKSLCWICTDLIVLILWTLCAVLCIYLPVVNETPLRIIFVVPLLLFIPGYIFIAALFPRRSISGIERFALSIGLSIVLVPIIGLILNFTSFGIRLNPIVMSLSVVIILMIIITIVRRILCARRNDALYSVPFEKIIPGINSALFPKDGGKFEKILSIILIVAVIGVAVTTVYVIVNPKDGEKFTEFYILGADKMADNYPVKFYENTEQFVWAGIKNHEYCDITYVMDVLLLDAEWDNETGVSKINKELAYERVIIPVADADEYLEQYFFSVPDETYNRIEFLLYEEANAPLTTASAQEKMNAAYRALHLWIKPGNVPYTAFSVTVMSDDANVTDDTTYSISVKPTDATAGENVVYDAGVIDVLGENKGDETSEDLSTDDNVSTDEVTAVESDNAAEQNGGEGELDNIVVGETTQEILETNTVTMVKYKEIVENPFLSLATLNSGNIMRSVAGVPAYPETSYTWYKPVNLQIQLGNYEYAKMTYTVDVVLMKINGSTVVNTWNLDRFTVSLANANELDEIYDFTLWKDDYNEIAFLLYKYLSAVPAFEAKYAEKAGKADAEERILIRFE